LFNCFLNVQDDLDLEDARQEVETEETEEEESTRSSKPNESPRWMQNGGGDSNRFSNQVLGETDRIMKPNKASFLAQYLFGLTKSLVIYNSTLIFFCPYLCK